MVAQIWHKDETCGSHELVWGHDLMSGKEIPNDPDVHAAFEYARGNQ
jgi:hypothetical protein